VLARNNDLQVTESFGIQDDRVVRWWPNARASTAVFRLQRR